MNHETQSEETGCINHRWSPVPTPIFSKDVLMNETLQMGEQICGIFDN